MAVLTTFFQTGLIVVTVPAQLRLHQLKRAYMEFLARHVSCDFGDVTHEVEANNYAAVGKGGPITSFYDLAPGEQLSVSTTGDRTLTRVALYKDGAIS